MELFEKNTFAGITLKNRIIRSATHEGLANEHGRPLEPLIDLYEQIAMGGVGMIITGYAGILKSARSCSNMAVFDSDEQVAIYKKIITTVKKHHTPIMLQIGHAGGLGAKELVGKHPVAPSKRCYKINHSTSVELTAKEIEELIAIFVSCIFRAKRAGFDGVQLLAAHGYLLSEFLSPYLNRRKDKWGGSTENRFRIIKEILTRSREKVGTFPIIIKISGNDEQKGGMNPEEAVAVAKLLELSSCDAIEVSCGNGNLFETVRCQSIPYEVLYKVVPGLHNVRGLKKSIINLFVKKRFKLHREIKDYNVEIAEQIKKAVSVPVISVGGIRELRSANEIVESGKSDYVALCRPLINEPDLPKKWKKGEQSVSNCIDCNYCLLACVKKPLQCYRGKLPEDFCS
ncbi:NADH:flavin oxidoreductase [Chitinispirillales bacterium ANBcel5]|uniref:NADH:flavin oxidoreductase n=1 Tax=Cellulosispirillum alkaliphilum TaxID=3039283 RepID=UPI002A545AC3|nr:NADH:flavin oxidoreductase [Chitinispirillales bacterium ANBcel5]